MRERYFSTFQLILAALLAALIVVAKIGLRTPIRMPGHTGIFWMAIIIVAAGIIPRRGAASLVGVTSGIIAGFMGMGDYGSLNTFLSYAAVGLGTDLILLLLQDVRRVIPAVFSGIFGHLGKFLVKWIYGILTGAPIGFVTLGLARALVSYIVFGALGGFLGWLTLRALEKAGFFAYLEEKR